MPAEKKGDAAPPLGDALRKGFRVPIGFANVAAGATISPSSPVSTQPSSPTNRTGQVPSREM
jgi:hypothetical protein